MSEGPSEWCTITVWRGYWHFEFYAVARGTGNVTARSRGFRKSRSETPQETERSRAAYDDVLEQLKRAGWKLQGTGGTWFEAHLSRPGPSQVATSGMDSVDPRPLGPVLEEAAEQVVPASALAMPVVTEPMRSTSVDGPSRAMPALPEPTPPVCFDELSAAAAEELGAPPAEPPNRLPAIRATGGLPSSRQRVTHGIALVSLPFAVGLCVWVALEARAGARGRSRRKRRS